MNANHSTTVRQQWRKIWALARRCEARGMHTTIALSLHSECARLYLAAMTAIAARHSHTAALMARPLPHSIDAEWLINTRCNRYAALSGRIPG